MTNELKHKLIQTNSFIDEAFDTERTDLKLIMQLSLDGITITVNETLKNKYIAFESFTFQNVYSFELVNELLDELIKKSKIIKHKYKQMICVVENNSATIVPKAIYEEDNKKLYLKFNTSLDDYDLILTDELKSLDAKNIFSIPTAIQTKLNSLNNNIQYHHSSTILIETLLKQNKNKTGKKLFVHAQLSHFQVVVIESKNLLFYNTFNHHSAEDFIYYLLFVCEQLQLNPENIDLTFIGEIEKKSTIYSITQKYIRHIQFGERNDNAEYSYQLQHFSKHSYFTLFTNYLA
ncbi:MAG: DUF3822 family protein [Bacteroidia bacterium]